MGLHFLVRVAFLVSIALIGANSSFADRKVLHSDFPKRYKFRGTTKVDITDTRFLRGIDPPEKGYGEERTGKLSFYEKLKDAFMYSKITTEKLQKWLKNEKSADTVFMRLHLDQDDIMFYTNPRFAEWVQYADSLSAKIPEMSAISILTNRYGDDLLYSIIQSAKESPYTNKLGLELETKQMQHWLATGKDPDEVFRLFKLNTDVSRIFDRPQFTMWAKYVDDLNSKHPEESLWMYSTLTKYFSDDALLQITKRAKWSKKDKAIAIKVENDWIREGIQNHKTPYQVLLDVELGDNLMEQFLVKTSVLKIWYKYMNVFNKRYPEEKTSMMETFTQRFGDVGMTNMLHASKQQNWDTTSAIQVEKLAMKLEAAQLKMWLDSGKTTDDVFKLLKLDEKANRNYFKDKVLLTTWVSYVNAFIAKNPGQKDELFSALKLRFEDRPLNEILNIAKTFPSIESAANKIQTDKIQNYLVKNESPKRVFELLGLTKDRNHILDSPVFQSWMQYVEVYNKKNPNKQESWFALLRETYHVERMFVQAMQNPSTMKIGKMMETEWMKHSLNKKYSPKDTFAHLGLKAAGDNALISPAFKTWTQYLNAFNTRYPEQKVTMIDGILDNFTEYNLLRAFQTAKKDKSTEQLVTNLQDGLINKWIAGKKIPTELKWTLRDITVSEEIIERYIKKLAATTTS